MNLRRTGIRRRGSWAVRRIPLVIGTILCGATSGFAQDLWPSQSIVDVPTAGLVPRGSFETQARVYPAGGLDVNLEVGILHWLSIGASYGGLRIIGDGEPDWYPQPGFLAKVRVVEETYAWPAFAFGIDTQGSGFWDGDRDRYQFKSRGLFGVASKNYSLFGDLAVHGGISRSLEDPDGDTDITLFVGGQKSIGPAFSVGLEYDLATNDDRDDGAYGKGRGYMNARIRWNLAPQMQVSFAIRDMLDNSESSAPGSQEVVVDEGWGREPAFSYVESF